VGHLQQQSGGHVPSGQLQRGGPVPCAFSAGKGWALILLTALLATQSIGRVPVYLAEDRRYARLLRGLLVAGFAVTLIAVGLLWLPPSSREYLFG
jgi:hypothetical protein